jgi:hypothetical protein
MKKTYILLTFLLPLLLSAQSLSTISPVNGLPGESIVLTITGKNTLFTSGTNVIKLIHVTNSSGKIISSSVDCINDTLLKAAISLGTNNPSGNYNVVVENISGNGPYQLMNAFTLKVSGGAILSVTPSVSKQADTIDLIVKSTNTHFTDSPYWYMELRDPITNAFIHPSSFSVIGNETVKGKFAFSYNDPAATYDVIIRNSQQMETIQLSAGFVLNKGPYPPQIISISPNAANKIDSALVSIKGKNTSFKKDFPSFFLAKKILSVAIYPRKIEYVSDTMATAFFVFDNRMEVGQYELITGVENLAGPFTLNAPLKTPELQSFDTKMSQQGDSVTMTIKGKNTHFRTGSTVLLLNGALQISTQSVNIISDSLLVAKFVFTYSNEPTNYWLYVDNWMDGRLQGKDAFTLTPGKNAPVLKSVHPDVIVQDGSDKLIQFHCSKDFLSKFTPSQIELTKNNSIYYYGYIDSVINDSTFDVRFGSALNPNHLGKHDINIVNWQGRKVTLSSAITVVANSNPASLVSVSPSSAKQFETVFITIKGTRTNFKKQSFDVYMAAADSSNFRISPRGLTIVDDSTMVLKFILDANYYPFTMYDMVVNSQIDGKMVKKSCFTVDRIYTQEPAIVDINPKVAVQGQSITMDISTTKGMIDPGKMEVKLISNFNPTVITPTSVKYINDSTLIAFFSFIKDEPAGTYYLSVNSKLYLNYKSNFTLKPTNAILQNIQPAWAAQTDSVKLILTGLNTHFDSVKDSIWLLHRKYGLKIKPYSIHALNDTMMELGCAFRNGDVPGEYTVCLKSALPQITLKLDNSFTLTGTINASALIYASPAALGCYIGGNNNSVITFKGTGTHFLSETDTVILYNTTSKSMLNPSKVKIMDDTTIVSEVYFGNNCGLFDVLLHGKNNYLLIGKIIVQPPISVEETTPEKEDVKIYPNPFEGIFTVEVDEDLKGASVEIINMLGKVIIQTNEIHATTEVDLSAFASGFYFVRITKNKVNKTMKIIKQ